MCIKGYRFGFNGKVKDDEVYGEGNYYEYKLRGYDPRIGRFVSADPKISHYPWYSPYQFAGNKPIWCIDIDGAEDGTSTVIMLNNWERDDQLYNEGKISSTEYQDRRYRSQMAYGIGAVAGITGAAIVYFSPHMAKASPIIAKISYQFLKKVYSSPAGQYVKDRSKDAAVDFAAQLFANDGDIDQVDWTGVASNYATPFKGKGGFVLNNTLKNGLDAAVDATFEDGFKVLGGPKGHDKKVSDAAVDFFVGQVVDNLSGAYKEYLKSSTKGMSEAGISQKVKDFGLTVKEYTENRIKGEMSESGKRKK